MRTIPLLFVSDSPEMQTGLARISRDLATLASRLPQFRVGFLGSGGTGSRQLPFPQYTVQWNISSGAGRWGEWTLPQVWADFAGRESGVVFTVWDASRLHWFARPQYLPRGELRAFLEAGHFVRWGYFPFDATGPGDRLTTQATDTLLGYDRILTYTKWADGLVRRSLGEEEARRRALTWLPHGFNFETFKPWPKAEGRKLMGPRVHDDDFLIGVVGTNQPRKDWGLVAAACAALRPKVGRRLRLWWHTDVLDRHWNIAALLVDYGLQAITLVSTAQVNDTELSMRYSACDLTLHPGLGEGFCYPMVESLACGTPTLHGDYAGGADILRTCGLERWLIPPVAWRLDPAGNCVRPVFEPNDWVEAILRVREEQPTVEECRASVAFLDWANLWDGCWKRWLLDGVGQL